MRAARGPADGAAEDADREGGPSSAWGAPLLLLLASLLLGAFLRFDQLELRAFGPDEGNYLFSAHVHQLETEAPVRAWPAEDLHWWGQEKTYPHSYLHQVLARTLYRLSGSAKLAIRAGSALFGLLTCAVFFGFYARNFPARRWVGAYTGALLALGCLQVWYSRSGWGATTATFFWAIYFWLGWELLRATTSRGRLAAGVGLCLAALASYGFHEMAAVYVIAMGGALLVVGPDRGVGRPGPSSTAAVPAWVRLARSPALRVWIVASIPVGLLTLNIFMFSPFAQEHWFDTTHGEDSYLTRRWRILEFLVASRGGLVQLLTVPVLALALIGAVASWRANRRFFSFLAANLVGAFVLFFLLFQDANLIRIHLPAACLVALLAAEGVVALVAGAGRLRPLALAAAAVLLVAQAWMTRATVFGAPGEPFFLPSFHVASRASTLAESARKEQVVVDYLEEHLQEGDTLSTVGPTPLFFLMDAGFRPTLAGVQPGEFLIGRAASTRLKLEQPSGRAAFREVPLDMPGDYWALFERVDGRGGSGSPESSESPGSPGSPDPREPAESDQ